MSLEEHYGFDPRDVPGLFCKEYFEMLNFSKFQFGLNNLFVFKKK